VEFEVVDKDVDKGIITFKCPEERKKTPKEIEAEFSGVV